MGIEWSLVNLVLIDFKLGSYIKVNVNDERKKFEVHVSKYLAKMAFKWHKIGQMPLFWQEH